MTAPMTAPRIITLTADRWRQRDVASCVRASLVGSLPLDAAEGTPIPHGVAPMAAGISYAIEACAQHADKDPAASAAAHRSRRQIRVRYGPEVAEVGGKLVVESRVEDDLIHARLSGERGLIADIVQRQVTEPATSLISHFGPLAAGSDVEDFTRVRVARWAYVSGELCAVHIDHVAATRAGLVAAIVPSSLLLAIAERRLMPDSPGEAVELVLDVAENIFAGERVSVDVDDRAATITFAAERGVLARARLLRPAADSIAMS